MDKAKPVEAATSKSTNRDAFLYWIHCNRCFSNYVKKEKPHYFLACKHVLCEPCLKTRAEATTGAAASGMDDATYKCPMCSRLVRTRQLGNSLPPHIKYLFHPEPWLDDLPTLHILSFQLTQRQHYTMAMARQKRQIMQEMQSCKTARNAAKVKYERIENLRAERIKLEKRVRAYIEQRNRERVERTLLRPPLPSTTDESYISTTTMRQRPRTQLHRTAQQILGGAKQRTLPNPIPRLPNPLVLNFTDVANSSFKL